MLQKISKQAYTLVELIIAVSISAVVLIIIFFFVTDSLVQLSETEKGSRFLTDFSRFSSQLQSQSTTFPNASFLIDNTSTSGFDIILLEREPGQDGIIWGVVDAESYTLIPNTEFGKYKNAIMGYRLASGSEIASLLATPTDVYTLEFFGDKTFSDFTVKNFQGEFYNLGDILSLDIEIVTVFEPEKVGILWSTLPRDTLFDVNLNF